MPKLPRIWRPPGETLPRGKWSLAIDFPLAALAFVWSFKTFTFMPLATAATWPLVIASTVLLIIVGIPLLFIETGIGQMTGYGSAMALRRMCPLLGGTGFVVIMHAVIICIQYSIFGSWSLYYAYALVREALLRGTSSSGGAGGSGENSNELIVNTDIDAADWRLLHCHNDYNTDLCVKIEDWNACARTWQEDQHLAALEESSQLSAAAAAAGFGVLDTNTTTLGSNLTSSMLINMVKSLVRRDVSDDDDVLDVQSPILHHTSAAAAAAATSHQHQQQLLREREAEIFRKEYEDGRPCVASSEEYFTHYVLQIDASLGDIGWPVGHLVPCLIIVWVLAFLVASKGARTIGRFSWIVILSSLFVLVAISLGSISLINLTMENTLPPTDGAISAKSHHHHHTNTSDGNGTNWSLEAMSDGVVTGEKRHTSLLDISVWMQAAEFVLITILFGTGNLTTLASYNRRRNNLMRDVFLIGFGHFAICLLVNANLSMWLQYVISTARTRAGLQFDFHEWRDWTLLFIVSPLVIKRQAHALLWALLFYIMIFLVALSTLYTALETLANFVQDEFLQHLRHRTVRVTGVVCVVGFVLSLFFTTRAGVFWLKLINHFINATSLIIMLLIVILVFVFGIERFKNGMRRSIFGGSSVSQQHSTDARGRWFFLYFHFGCYVSVAVIILTLIWILIINTPPLQYYGSGKPYPMWAHLTCFFMAVFCLSPIVLYPLYCCGKIWPNLRLQQQQQQQQQQICGDELEPNASAASLEGGAKQQQQQVQRKLSSNNKNFSPKSSSSSALSVMNGGVSNRLAHYPSNGSRYADSEILRRLQRSSTASFAAQAAATANGTPSGGGTLSKNGFLINSSSKDFENRQSPPKDALHADSFTFATDVMPKIIIEDVDSSATKKSQVKFFRGDSDGDETTTNGSPLTNSDVDKRHVKFSDQPNELVVLVPPHTNSNNASSPSVERKSSVLLRLFSALTEPHSYKLSIVETDDDDDDANGTNGIPGGGDDDDESDEYGRDFDKKKNKQNSLNNFALRLSSAREDDDDNDTEANLQFLMQPLNSAATTANGFNKNSHYHHHRHLHHLRSQSTTALNSRSSTNSNSANDHNKSSSRSKHYSGGHISVMKNNGKAAAAAVASRRRVSKSVEHVADDDTESL